MKTIKVNVDSTIAEIALSTYGSFVISSCISNKYKAGKTKLVFPDNSSLVGSLKIEDDSIVFHKNN